MNEVKSTNHDEMIPLKFRLSQNYPNPFKEKTKIKYCVAFRTNVNISVFDAKGKLIKNLIDKEHNAGTYEVEFNSASLTEGIYYYQINTTDFLETKEMILEK